MFNGTILPAVTILLFILGSVIGSFLNVVIFRTHAKESILWPASHCGSCKHTLASFDLIPILSFCAYKGQCKYCKVKISWQYPLVELATGLLFVLSYLHAGDAWLLLARDLIVGSFLIALFVYDLRYTLVPDQFAIPAVLLALGFNIALGIHPLHLLYASLLLGGFFLAQYVISKGRWVGQGDISLGILMGAYLGIAQGLFALWVSYVGGAIVILLLLAMKKVRMGDKIPFGPFLILATFASLYFSNALFALLGFTSAN